MSEVKRTIVAVEGKSELKSQINKSADSAGARYLLVCFTARNCLYDCIYLTEQNFDHVLRQAVLWKILLDCTAHVVLFYCAFKYVCSFSS